MKNNKEFSPKKHTPWDALEDFAKSLIPNEIQQQNIVVPEIPINGIQKGNQNSIRNDVHNGTQNILQNGIQNGLEESKTNKRYTKKIRTVYAKDPNGIQKGNQNGIQKNSSQEVDIYLIHSISGIKKRILLFIVDLCFKSDSLITAPINCKELSHTLNEKYASTKQAISRLKKDRLITSVKTKDGRGGFACFKITESVKFYTLEYKKQYRSINQQEIAQTVYKQNTKQYTTPYSSSSQDLNYNTTDYSDPTIDIERLSHIGFTQNHVTQILKLGTLTPEQLQESIEHYAFDLEHNDRARTFKLSPLDVFMGMMRKGTYYNAPPNYESKKALNLRLSLEAKAKRNQTEKELEDKLKEVEWKEWSEKLTEQELLEFYVEDKPLDGVPEKVQMTLKKRNALANAKEYFESEVWPKQKESLNDTNAGRNSV